jgi:hypothetical protein
VLAIVSTPAAAGLDPDEAPLLEGLRAELGSAAVEVVHWNDPTVEWSRLDAALIRATWDYIDALDDFLAWTDRVGRATRLLNPPAVVRWNVDKRYLGRLEQVGIPTVPTTYVAPGESAPAVPGTCVVKPTVGAGSNGARRCAPGTAAAHVATLHRAGRTAMVQPYLERLDDRGETALCFLPDRTGALRFSHAFSKAAILDVDEPEREGDLFAREEIGPRTPTAEERELARRVLAAEPVIELGPLAYARVDLAPSESGPVLMELELVEPSMYFDVAPGAAARAAAGFAAFLGS